MDTRLRSPQFVAVVTLALGAWGVWREAATSAAYCTTLRSHVAHPAMQAPAHLGEWVGKPLAVGGRAIEILETDAVTLMEYRSGESLPVWLAQVDGVGNRAAFHPPELCYVGSHYEILARGPIAMIVNGHPQRMMRLVISQDQKRFEAWYWFTAGSRTTSNYYQQQLWLLLDAIHGRPTTGSLLRLSTPMENEEGAHRRLLTFLGLFASDMQNGGRHEL